MDSSWTASPIVRFTGSIWSTRGRKGAALKWTTGVARLRSRPVQRQTPSRQRRGWGCLRCLVASTSAGASTYAGRSLVTQAWTTPPVWQQARGDNLKCPRTGVAGVGERLCVHAREHACELKNDPTLTPPGGKTPQRATPRLISAKRQRAQFGRGNSKVKGEVLLLLGECVHVRGCTGTRVCARMCACACQGHGHGDGRNDGGDATTRKTNRGMRKKGWLVCAIPRGKDGSSTCKKRFPSLANGRHHTAHTRWRSGIRWRVHKARCATSTRRSGARRGKDGDALTYGLRD